MEHTTKLSALSIKYHKRQMKSGICLNQWLFMKVNLKMVDLQAVLFKMPFKVVI